MSYRNLSLNSHYTFYPKSGAISRITPGFYASRRWKFDGVRKNTVLFAGLDPQFKKAQTYISINAGSSSEASHLNGICWPVEVHPQLEPLISNKVGLSGEYSKGVNVAYFALAKGNMTSYFASLNLKPVDRLIIQPSIHFTKAPPEHRREVL